MGVAKYLTHACAQHNFAISEACIGTKDSLSMKALYPALIDVGLDELQRKAISQIDGMYKFLIQ